MSLSTMAVSDVTGTAASGAATVLTPVSGQSEDTTITPFKTILNEATSAKKAQKSSSDATVRVKEAVEDKGKTNGGKTKLDNVFRRASEKYGVSYDFLVAIAKIESDFEYDCVSSAGAKGIMQLMPEECKTYGVTDPFDPEQSIMACAKIMASNLKQYNGDYVLAAAAYNAGPGAVKKYGGVPPYNETQNYVKKLKQYMKEGVKVPDKNVTVAKDYTAYEDANPVRDSGNFDSDSGSSSSGSSGSSGSSVAGFDYGVSATDDDWDKVRITVATGTENVTMTYGAYQKYKELGSLGVG